MKSAPLVIFQCSTCKLKYIEKKWADACEKWCSTHASCNLDIIRHAIMENKQET